MRNHFLERFLGLGLIASSFSMPLAHAATETLALGVKTSHYMNMNQKITRIAVGNAEVASVIQLPQSSSEFMIVTKEKPGSTSLYVWTADNVRREYLIVVSPEDQGQAEQIEIAINLPDVHVRKVDNRILLTGTVKNQFERNYAIQTARLFVGGNSGNSLSVGTGFDLRMNSRGLEDNQIIYDNRQIGSDPVKTNGTIIDLLQMLQPTQIRLEAQVIAIRPQDKQSIGITYGTDPVNNPGVVVLGESHFRSNGVSFRNNPIRWLTDHHSNINIALQALVSQNKAKILSRPSITTMSGEEASIQVGGEIPYSTRDGYGNLTTTFKDYGIILQLKPTVDANDNIISSVHAEVSSLAGENVNGQPLIDKRRADSVVTMSSGSTMVIGGLLDSSETKTVRKIPILGNIPILGEFFKYTSKSKDKHELIILVTPYLVSEDETNTAQMSDSMKEWYETGEKEKGSMQDIDLNDRLYENKMVVDFEEESSPESSNVHNQSSKESYSERENWRNDYRGNN